MICWCSYENNNVGNMAWNILKISPEMAELILARFLEWVLKVDPPNEFLLMRNTTCLNLLVLVPLLKL